MFLGVTPVSSVSNGLYLLTLPLISVMRVIYTSKGMSKKFWGARYTLGMRYLSKNTVHYSSQVKHNLLTIIWQYCEVMFDSSMMRMKHCSQVKKFGIVIKLVYINSKYQQNSNTNRTVIPTLKTEARKVCSMRGNTLTLKMQAPSSSGLLAYSVTINMPSYTRLFKSSLSQLYKPQHCFRLLS
jgi:hypothetical protein